MTITSHGASCDVCNGYILFGPSTNPFSIFGVDGLHCHDECKQAILALDTKSHRFWDALPEGRVRQLANDIWERDQPAVTTDDPQTTVETCDCWRLWWAMGPHGRVCRWCHEAPPEGGYLCDKHGMILPPGDHICGEARS